MADLRAEQAGTLEAQIEAAAARAQAEESRSAVHGEAAEVQPFTPSPELKKLYREAAKRVHPDAATDELDRARREQLMKAVNQAYSVGDEDELRRILDGLGSRPDAVKGSGVASDLIRVLRQLKQVRDRIIAIDQEMLVLAETELAKLKAKADLAAATGRDVLAEIATKIQGQINVTRQVFKESGHAKN
ncbi:MAG: J domain-containing protein [Edaphobacter sp.]